LTRALALGPGGATTILGYLSAGNQIVDWARTVYY